MKILLKQTIIAIAGVVLFSMAMSPFIVSFISIDIELPPIETDILSTDSAPMDVKITKKYTPLWTVVNTTISYLLDWTNDSNWIQPSVIPDRDPNKPKWRYPLINYPIATAFKVSKKAIDIQSITIVTQCSIDRIDAIHTTARVWTGPISVAIFIPKDANFNRIDTRITQLFDDIESNYKAILHISLLFEIETALKRQTNASAYPINSMRNLALQQAITDWIMVIDADFIPSFDFHNIVMTQHRSLLDQTIDKKIALIAPAFDLNTTNFSDNSLSSMTKPNIIAWEAQPFHKVICEGCHAPTNFPKWETAVESYDIKYVVGFEPYFITRRVGYHRYDARFSGFGWNKIIHLNWISDVDKYRFVVLNDVFIASPQHPKSEDSKRRFEKSHIDWIQTLNKMAQKEMRKEHKNIAGTIIH